MTTFDAPYLHDKAHPIHAALALARAIDDLNRCNDTLPHAPYDDVLGKLADLVGGVSEDGYEHDLASYVLSAESDAAEDDYQDWRDQHPFAHRCDAPTMTGYGAGVDAAQDWLDDAQDVLASAGLVLCGAEIVPADVAGAVNRVERLGVEIVA